MGRHSVTQTMRVMQYMQDFGTITSAQAFLDLGVMDLPKCISVLRRRGHAINGEVMKSINRYGEPCHFKKYSLIEAEE